MDKLSQALQERQDGKSLRALARELGVATGTAESWLKGWRRPDIPNLPKLADYLGVPIDEIIHWIIEDDQDGSPIIHVTPWFARPIDVLVAA